MYFGEYSYPFLYGRASKLLIFPHHFIVWININPPMIVKSYMAMKMNECVKVLAKIK